MEQVPASAMIMAAGLGLRMRPLTLDRPKPLVMVQGRTLLDHCLDRLLEAGVRRVIVNVHYMADQIVRHCAGRNDIAITIQDETAGLLDTGGALVRARPFFEEQPAIVLNSDSIWLEGMGSNLKRLARAFRAEHMDCMMLLATTFNAIGFDGRGDFHMDATGRLKRRDAQKLAPFAMPGAQIIHPRFLDDAPQGAFSTNVLWDRGIERDRVFGLRMEGRWMHIGTPEAVKEAEDFLRRMSAPA